MEKIKQKKTNKCLQDQEVLNKQIRIKQTPGIIQRLKNIGFIHIDQLSHLLKQSSSILQNQPTLLPISSPVTIVGDIHGQFYDLLGLFDKFGYPPATTYLFLGDYVDRGKFCIQVMTLLLHLKVSYPQQIHLLRGNHQGRSMTTLFNFKQECQKKYARDVYQRFLELFMKLPLCALIDKRYFAVHGGIGPSINMVSQINTINRFSQISEGQVFFDLLWADPKDSVKQTWSRNTDRGCSYFFSPNQTQNFLKKNSIKMIIRGHEVTAQGFKYQVSSKNEPLAITVFSAPNYCKTYGNKAVVAQIQGQSLELKYIQEKVEPFLLFGFDNIFEFTLPLICSKVASLFKHMVRKSRKKQLMKKKTLEEKKEDLHTMEILEIIDFKAGVSADKMLNFLSDLSKSQTNQTIKSQQIPIEELIFKIAAMKYADLGERYNTSFGPKNITFVNYSSTRKRLQEIQIDEERLTS